MVHTTPTPPTLRAVLCLCGSLGLCLFVAYLALVLLSHAQETEPATPHAADCQLKNGPMTIMRSGTLDTVYALGKAQYAYAVERYGACRSVPTGTALGLVSRGLLTSTVIVKAGPQRGCTGDLENDFITCH